MGVPYKLEKGMPYMDARAYVLSDDHDLATFGGSVTLRDGTSYDVKQALEDGNGEIVTADTDLQTALNVYPALVGRATDEVAPDAPEYDDGYEKMLKADLEGLVEARNADRAEDDRIAVADGALKDDIISALRADDQEGGR